jgi:hypothetical protein
MFVWVGVALIVGFYAGRVYQTAVATWGDHVVARGKEQALRRARWLAWRATVLPLAGVGLVAVLALIAR